MLLYFEDLNIAPIEAKRYILIEGSKTGFHNERTIQDFLYEVIMYL